MIAILSPTKNMQRVEMDRDDLTVPVFIEHTKPILKELQRLSPFDVESLMKVNEKLAVQAFMDFQDFSYEKKGTAAVFTYDGLVFKNIKAGELQQEELEYLNEHLRILSGLYGVVRPLDGILPYRLEMQCKLKVEDKSLYDYWEKSLYEELYKNDDIIINLASTEYSKAVSKYLKKENRWIDIEFVVFRDGKLKTVATLAKMARGQMIRFMATEKITTPEELKRFEGDGYTFEESLSSEDKYVFVMK